MRSGNGRPTGAALRVVPSGGSDSAQATKGSEGTADPVERGREQAARDERAQARVDGVIAEIDKAIVLATHAIARRDEEAPSGPRLPITVPVRVATCPGLKLVSPNRVRGTTRGAALSEASRRKRLREIGLLQTKGTLTQMMLDAVKTGMGKADITITRVAPKHFDDDNYVSSCKALRDGIAEALGVADNHPNLMFWYEQIHGRPKEYAVRIEYRFTRKS